MASYNNSKYSNDFFDLTGVYFNSTSQTNSNINIDELKYIPLKLKKSFV